MARRITQQDEESMSLNQNTQLIQTYNNLEYSDEYESSHSSQQHSLSGMHRAQMMRAQEMSRVSRQDYLDAYLRQHHSKKKQKGRDLESKYDFGVSPSTKEQYSLLNPQPRLSGSHKEFMLQSRQRNREREMPSLNEDSDQPSQSQEPQNDRDSGREAVLGRKKSSGVREQTENKFDIDSFLNAHPMPPKNKKGISVLGQNNQSKIPSNYMKQSNQNYFSNKVNNNSQKNNEEDDTIVLMTLPQKQTILQETQFDRKALNKALTKTEQQLQQWSDTNPRRYNQIRLNFINTFTPDPLKPKSTPYNYLRYMMGKKFL